MKTIDDLAKQILKKKIEEMIDQEVAQQILDSYYDFAITGVGKIKIKAKNEKDQQI
jgi:hypothetical protein